MTDQRSVNDAKCEKYKMQWGIQRGQLIEKPERSKYINVTMHIRMQRKFAQLIVWPDIETSGERFDILSLDVIKAFPFFLYIQANRSVSSFADCGFVT